VNKFLASVAVLAFVALAAPAQEAKPKFFLEDGKVVERVAATESGLADLKKQVASLQKEMAELKGSKVIATGEGGDLSGDGPVTIPLKPVKADCPCTTCTCAAGTCPGGCPTTPTQSIQYMRVCGPNGCQLVPVSQPAAPQACYPAASAVPCQPAQRFYGAAGVCADGSCASGACTSSGGGWLGLGVVGPGTGRGFFGRR
jgi:hypothetical protein